ncbi:leucyl/phenylalanyl-tRNA--protein transferase [Marinobacterium jannaschii]|uniref:leucyl/phenylalanyl-tRNA--protein transferase n=1 Tax=Marinobacterium jannaschii TaxID=64970 RepID=UPI000481973F|nr:leucyl/phenylalanyl-tRNA--protein transferase [Marinobacterium jannaschii]
MIFWLESPTAPFPPVGTALKDPNGLLAAGGDLSTDRLLGAYRRGIFPWYNPGEPILWWSPDPRCIITPDRLHISRSMKKRLRKKDFQITFDQDFHGVIEACAAPRENEAGTWISREMKHAYQTLHQEGHAHSVEVWMDGELAGGLYGVAIGRVFFGESMFSRQRDASKIAFIGLVEQLRFWGYALIDCQVTNSHLLSLGAYEVPRSTFLQHLEQSIDITPEHEWIFDPNCFECGNDV